MNMPIDRRSLLQLLALSPLLTLPALTHSASTAMRVTLTGQALMKYPICDAPYPGLDEVIAELQRGDVIFTNLEVPIQTAESGLPTRDTEFFHVGSAQTLSCLQLMGFNLLP